MFLEKLIERQNPDGGWPHVRGKSATEPTAYAVLALLSAGANDPAGRGAAWLRSVARADGGWPPQAGVDESTWVTALVALVPPERLGVRQYERAIRWLLATTGKESTPVHRLRQWLLGNRTPAELDRSGWPWTPGTAAWVAPTAVAVLALEKAALHGDSPAIRKRIAEGREFLLSRACPEGGWNHGSVPDLSDHPKPYPEMTGLALAALRGVNGPEVQRGLAAARDFLKDCRSGEALNWLRLGLMAHGQLPAGYCPPEDATYHTVPEVCLETLARGGGLA